jgi:hypothetical protein
MPMTANATCSAGAAHFQKYFRRIERAIDSLFPKSSPPPVASFFAPACPFG